MIFYLVVFIVGVYAGITLHNFIQYRDEKRQSHPIFERSNVLTCERSNGGFNGHQ